MTEVLALRLIISVLIWVIDEDVQICKRGCYN